MERNDIAKRIPLLAGFIDRSVAAAMKYHEGPVENYMKANAPWTDRTTNARNGLAARYVPGGTKHSLVLFHQVPYGIWLEVRHDGKYAIIMPTVQEFGPKVMHTLEQLLNTFNGGRL